MGRKLELYYDVVCPYAYLASTQAEAFAARHGADLEWKPILLGGILNDIWSDGAPFTNPAKARLGALDLTRWADHWGVRFQWPHDHPRRTVNAMRVLTAVDGAERVSLSHALYRAYWVEGRDVSDMNVLADVVGPGNAARARDPETKNRLREATARARDRGIFGVPTFFVGDEMFWGQDRFDFIATALTG